MKILILGGGIAGLSAAWFLHHAHPHAQITLLEKQPRLGGWIQTSREGGFFFEKGPRTFLLGKCPKLLQLIQELKLEIIQAKPQKRYLWHKGRLRSMASFLPRFLPTLLRECFRAPSPLLDESIYEFAARRFSPALAETLFDPLTLGIYGGDFRKLSLRACFPTLHEWEQTHGSILRALFSVPKQEKGLFTLRHGMDTLIHTLQERLPLEIVLNCTVETIGKNEVLANGKVWSADRVISTLPPPFPAQSLWVVHLAYEGDVLPKKGFGYLVPTREKETLLGVVFDSSIFPEQNRRGETRLTAMLRPEEKEPLSATLDALQRHLGLQQKPIYSALSFAKDAIPQFPVGCTYRGGVSVEARIEQAARSIL